VALAVLLLGALADLWLAGTGLEHRNPVPNLAWRQPREAITALQARMATTSAFRMLSIATTEYVVKETGEYQERYADLPPLALANLFYEVKWNETLLPNVPLSWRLASADGYDGGVLPLQTFYTLARAMLGPDEARPDGVLASRLDELPEARWLDLLGVRWGLASRIKDDSRGAIYYDRGITQTLGPGQSLTLTALPGGSFTTLGMISSLAAHTAAPTTGTVAFGRPERPSGSTVGALRLGAGDGQWQEIPLVVGQNTAPELWRADEAPGLERVERWSGHGPDGPADWLAEIALPHRPIARLQIANTTDDEVIAVRALNLIDDDRQAAFPITPDSRVERLDLFDLKLYDRQDALPRAHLVPAASVADDDGATARLRDPAFDPRAEAVLAPSPTAQSLTASTAAARAGSDDTAELLLDEPERVQVRTHATSERYLVLSDSWYPGWLATVDGVEVPIERANLLFRAVRLGPGEHLVEFRYEPRSVRLGALVSGGSIMVGLALLVGAVLWRRRRRGVVTV
jgi:hypothetical protein